ncbi:UNVERIFIED_CONTAM: Jerky-like protein [Trichonephila clavipes]
MEAQRLEHRDKEDGSKNRKTTREANNVLLDHALYLWFTQRRSKGDLISGPLLREKALELNDKLGGLADFKASTGWLKNLKSRYGIRELQIEVKSLTGGKNSACKFTETFLKHVEKKKVNPVTMFTM